MKNRILIGLTFILISSFSNAQSLMDTVLTKIVCTDSYFLVNKLGNPTLDDYWFNWNSEGFEVRKGEKKIHSERLFSFRGDAILRNNGNEVYCGIFTYNFETNEKIYNKSLTDAIKRGYSKKLFRSDIIFHRDQYAFDESKKRIVVLLDYNYINRRPIEKNKPKTKSKHIPNKINLFEPIPFTLIGLVDLETNSLIRLLGSAKKPSSSDKFLSLTKNCIVVVGGLGKDKINIWNLRTGRVIKKQPYPIDEIVHLTPEKSTNHVVISLKNGTVQRYKLKKKNISIIKDAGEPVYRSFPLLDGSLYLVSQENKQCLLYKKTPSGYELLKSIKLEDVVNDAHYDAEKEQFFLAVKNEVLVYHLPKL